MLEEGGGMEGNPSGLKASGGAARLKERGILFSAPMVRAVLEDRKTQTRRIVKPQPEIYSGWDGSQDGEYAFDWKGGDTISPEEMLKLCPYGQPGDRLWVRETWMESHTGEAINGRGKLLYRASWGNTPEGQHWRPSIFMPRWASRLTLDVTGIRVERLQDITANDILAEGVVDPQMTIIAGVGVHHPDRLRTEWIKLWDSINADRAPWDSNPWVWVVEFRKARSAPEPSSAKGSPSSPVSPKHPHPGATP